MQTGQSGEREAGLVSVSIEDVRAKGYPVNENGETYGPLLPEARGEEDGPDLAAVQNEEGIQGYVREKEIVGVRTRSEILENTENKNRMSADMYLQDGKTVVGKFKYNN